MNLFKQSNKIEYIFIYLFEVKEIFTSGTAVTIGPVCKFNYKDVDYDVPID